MNHKDYETIIACIQYGAPALYNQLITSLNKVIENSNAFIQAELDRREAVAKAEAIKAEAKPVKAEAVKTVK